MSQGSHKYCSIKKVVATIGFAMSICGYYQRYYMYNRKIAMIEIENWVQSMGYDTKPFHWIYVKLVYTYLYKTNKEGGGQWTSLYLMSGGSGVGWKEKVRVLLLIVVVNQKFLGSKLRSWLHQYRFHCIYHLTSFELMWMYQSFQKRYIIHLRLPHADFLRHKASRYKVQSRFQCVFDIILNFIFFKLCK